MVLWKKGKLQNRKEKTTGSKSTTETLEKSGDVVLVFLLFTLNTFQAFFFVWVFFHEHSQITVLQGKGEGIPLTPQYHFHPLHRHLDISREFTAESSHLHVASKPVSNRKPLASERK